MRVLIYGVNFAPEPTGIGKYTGEMAAWLKRNGHEVRVITAPPYYPEWRVDRRYTGRLGYRREQWQGIRVWRAPLWVPSTPGGLKRIVHLASFAATSLPLVLRQAFWRPDVVLTVAPAFLCAPGGWLAARLCRARAWLHIQDFEIDVAFQLGMLRNKALRRVTLGLEKHMLRRFDAVSTISHRMVDRLLEKGVRQPKVRFFPNWVDTDEIKPPTDRSGVHALRAELSIADDAIVVLFSGTLGAKQGLMLIPEAARLLAHRDDIVFVVCGEGIMKQPLIEATRGMANVRHVPLQPFERLSLLLGMADIHLLTQSPEASDLVLPSKLTGMLASGRPIVATCEYETEIASVVRQCGVVVKPEDPKALSIAVGKLADDVEERLRLGRRARSWAESNVRQDHVLSEMFSRGIESKSTNQMSG